MSFEGLNVPVEVSFLCGNGAANTNLSITDLVVELRKAGIPA